MEIFSWKSYYWNFFKEFGAECYRTWRGEMLASVLMVGFIFLINHAAIDLRTGLLASGYTLATFATWHLLRTPWLVQKRINSGNVLHWGWAILGMSFGIGTIALWLYTSVWFYTMQPPVNLTTRFPDSRDAQIVLLKHELDTSKESEAPNSLRRRTEKAADELYGYLSMRAENQPPVVTPNSNDPNPSEESKKGIQRYQRYAKDTEDYYQKRFQDRMVGIVKEYQAKGVHTRFLENDFMQRVPGMAFIGSSWEGSSLDELSQFRDLAYHVDAHDNLITF